MLTCELCDLVCCVPKGIVYVIVPFRMIVTSLLPARCIQAILLYIITLNVLAIQISTTHYCIALCLDHEDLPDTALAEGKLVL